MGLCYPNSAKKEPLHKGRLFGIYILFYIFTAEFQHSLTALVKVRIHALGVDCSRNNQYLFFVTLCRKEIPVGHICGHKVILTAVDKEDRNIVILQHIEGALVYIELSHSAAEESLSQHKWEWPHLVISFKNVGEDILR